MNETKWIPVEERLPEEYGEYLITWTCLQCKGSFIAICEVDITDEYDHEHGRFKVEWLLDTYIKEVFTDVEVIAWMPLPEPYDPKQPENGSVQCENTENTHDRTTDGLISRQLAIDAVHEEFDECTVWDESGEYTADEVERVLRSVPTVRNVTRCRDCKYCIHAKTGKLMMCDSWRGNRGLVHDDDCSNAERREDG